mmetsp:Transcript_1164/g.2807  ORF Transcript_1164/g.2807 Transcript_1164/m.2807 type:complete len:244 (+) Transcript_1164:14-745(+)
MVKDLDQRNRKHTVKRDRKGKRERSKEEHLKKKLREQKKMPPVIDSLAMNKLLAIVKDLIKHNEEVKTELPGVAEMLDKGNDVDVTDIEDVFVREKLERLLELFEGYVERVEAEDGSFSFRKSSEESLKDQVVQLIMRASETAKRPEWMNSMADSLEREIGPAPPQHDDNSYGPTLGSASPVQDPQVDMEEYMEAYNREHRPKSLMEIHMEKKKASGQPKAVLYGHKNLNKRFAEGKFQTHFM